MRYLAAIALMFALVMPARPALARQAAGATRDGNAARQHYERGQALVGEKRYSEARREFEAGYAVDPRPLFLFNAAESARLDNDLVGARAAYERYVKEDPAGKFVSLANKRLAEIDERLRASAPPPVPTPLPVGPAAGTAPAGPAPGAAPAGPNTAAPVPTAPPPTEPQPAPYAPQPAPAESSGGSSNWPLWAALGVVVVGGAVAAVALTRDNSPSCDTGCVDLR